MAANNSNIKNITYRVRQNAPNKYTFRPYPPTADYYEVFVEKELGTGAYGKVYLGTSIEYKGGKKTSETKVAIKTIDTISFKSSDLANLKNEISILREISNKDICHKYLLCIDYVGEGAEGTKIDGLTYIVTEYIDGGDLFNFVQSSDFSVKDATHAICSLLNGILILHRKDLVHRDIKLDNIMYDKSSNSFKLVDYGFACLEDRCAGKGGSPSYAAPEVVSDQKISDFKKTDIWSAGITIFFILLRLFNKVEYIRDYQNFTKNTENYLRLEGELQKHLTNTKNETDNELIKKLEPIILGMVKTDPKERSTIEEVIHDIRDICSHEIYFL